MRKILAPIVVGGLLAGGVTTTATPNDLNLGEDNFAFVLLDFSFTFYGVDYTGIWVNRYGNVTFGSADAQFQENLPEFLNEQPRIAQLSRHELEEQQRGTVRPVEVVEHEHQRRLARGVAEKRGDAVEQAEARLVGIELRRRRQSR